MHLVINLLCIFLFVLRTLLLLRLDSVTDWSKSNQYIHYSAYCIVSVNCSCIHTCAHCSLYDKYVYGRSLLCLALSCWLGESRCGHDYALFELREGVRGFSICVMQVNKCLCT